MFAYLPVLLIAITPLILKLLALTRGRRGGYPCDHKCAAAVVA
jgi:hypothetical protein